MVNLEWYRSFVTVYRVGTVSGAAQALHLTQPAVSQHIAALEAALGNSLFTRMPRKMLPTAAGKSLYTQVAASIEQLESVATRSSLTDTLETIRLGAPQEFFTERILNQLPQLENLHYRVQFGLAPELIEQLLVDKLDVVIATQKIANSELEYYSIATESFWLVAPPQIISPIDLTIPNIDLKILERWIKTYPLIAYSEDLPIIRRFWRVVFGRRLDLIAQLILPDLHAIRQAIAAGFGFSVLPDYLCDRLVASGDLTLILQPTNPVTNQIWLAYKKTARHSEAIAVFRSYF
jgi:DNA-binding transcriptional LysR family regulator